VSTVLGYVVVLLPDEQGKDGTIVTTLTADRSDAEHHITAWRAEVPAAVRETEREPVVATVTVDDPAVTA
jgi:hypothetical protein